MNFPRASGILLHPTSLPGDFGIGDLGPGAYAFVNFLEEARQTYWQILPLGPTGYGDSPYQCFSAFAGNLLLISPEALVEDGLLDAGDIGDRPEFPEGRVDYGAVYEWKTGLLARAFERFGQRPLEARFREDLERFEQDNGWWLHDYALYRAIKASREHAAWYEWPTPLKLRDPAALAAAAGELSEQVAAEKLFQFLFFRQWRQLREYANKHGIRIIGDIPIFVALDSADVWCNQSKFKLNPDGSPRVVAGVPPDYFSKTGQLWGNPIYDWEAMSRDNFSWWIARVAFSLRTVDVVRVDHFRGFASAWEVPGTDETAENGEWVEVPGKELFGALRQHLGEAPIIAEDLGVITPDVRELRDGFGFPGMKILQFAFGGDAMNHDLPHNYEPNCVAYTGNHDNETVVGWWRSQGGGKSRRKKGVESPALGHCIKYLNADGSEINWDFIRAVWASVAHTAITPMQDVLGLGNEARMNLPASTSGNWSWRCKNGSITEEITGRLRELTGLYGREPK